MIPITGCSSGFGLQTAKCFLDRHWTVVATMRTPRQDVLPHSERLRLLALDVTDPENIRQAVEAAGPDALVNNAGLRRGVALRGRADGNGTRGFRDQYLRYDGCDKAALLRFRQRRPVPSCTSRRA
jgi:NAD(P)-dependent dehydrogenase (short-subunit alcohol dehydrogenase family)